MTSLSTLLKHLPNEGLFNLSHLGTIRVSGDNAKKFLQGQLTCNLEEVNPTYAPLGAYCNIKGRVIALFRVIQVDQDYHLLIDKELIEIVVKTLLKYAVFSRVSVEIAADFSQYIGLMAKRPDDGDEAASHYLPDALLDLFGALTPLSFPQQIDGVLSTDYFTICRIPGASPRWEILVRSKSAPISTESLQSATGWHAHNILTGLPTLTKPTSGQFTPHKLGLIRLNAVSFSKGCYLGQEIVARTQYLGTTKGGLFWASIESADELAPQMAITDANQQIVGNIINCTTIINNTTLVLATLNQNLDEKTTLSIANHHALFLTPFVDEFA